MKNNNLVGVIALLLLTSSLLIVTDNFHSAQAKPRSSHGHSVTAKASKTGGFAVQPPIGTGPTPFATSNNSAAALAIAHRLAINSVNASRTNGDPCLPQLDHFILPAKEARFTLIKQCVTVTGMVVWTHYFNNDGDAIAGSYSQVFTSKYPGGPAMHMETVCQAPVTSKSKENVGACNGYNGPDFRHVLPKIGQHVMVTGRYLIEMPEMPGGITELHPVYGIKILP